MSMTSWWPYLLLCACAATYRHLFLSNHTLPLPPGPCIGWFGAGKRERLPRMYPWLAYNKWRKKYGDLIYLDVFRNPMLVLNSLEAAQELLEKKGAIYSSRPVRTMQAELMGFGFLFSGLPYNNWYKQHRNMFNNYFQPKSVSNYHALQLKHAYILLRNIMNLDPENPALLDRYLRRTTAAIVLEICYGHHVAEKGDEYVTLADSALAGITTSGVFGSYMVDYIPLLKHVPSWMPGAKFKRQAFKWKKLAMKMLNQPFDMVKEQMKRGSAEYCLTSAELERWFQEGGGEDKETIIKDVAATSYAAGSDTTLSTLATFFLAMVLHPEAQKKAQAELDRFVPHDRLPDFSDRDNLPYLECLVWECLRWNPAVNIALAHLLTENDDHKGYRIPKGTTVLGNIWTILHDNEHYPNPMEFKPDRYLDADDNFRQGINPTPTTAFGFGRRICPGRWLALDTIWIVAASVLSVYKLMKPANPAGQEIEPHVEYTSGLCCFSRPKPFGFRIVPRSKDAVTKVEQTTHEV
ncbi:O-methylsterigmatocystin oxidoreductase [Termitomyces sp. J132]|nr:O-methylsterigmatocystin oxidoreductase [Termitomyces sp. J132]